MARLRLNLQVQKRYLKIAVASLAVFLLGFWLGRVTSWVEGSLPPQAAAPEVGAPSSVTAFNATEPPQAAPASDSKIDLLLKLAEKVQSEEGAGAALVKDLTSWGHDPSSVVAYIINEMSDRELTAVVTSITGFTEEELEQVPDKRAFVKRLTEVAMAGVLTDPPPREMTLEEIAFSSLVNPDNSATLPQETFHSDAERIYAVFATDEYAQEEVLVKWFKTDQPSVLLFERFPVVSADEYSYVWLESPDGWDAGEYQVSIHAADAQLKPLAVGSYAVGP